MIDQIVQLRVIHKKHQNTYELTNEQMIEMNNLLYNSRKIYQNV